MAKTEKKLTPGEVIHRRRANLMIHQGYISLLFRCVMLTVVLVVLFTQVFLLVQARGNEMFPAIRDGDLVFAYRLQRAFMKNDVVVYRQNGVVRIGRVLGRSGDVIMLDDTGNLLVNGTNQGGDILYPTYAKDNLTYPYVVPEGSCFLLCDYRTRCEDSRDFGAVALKDVEGKVITILRRRGI